MTSFPGGTPSELRPFPSCPPLSSLSPLAAPFKANGRPLASDPIHNPASLGRTAPTMLHSSQHQRSIPPDEFLFGSRIDGVSSGGAPPYYQPYEPWKPSWGPDGSGDGSGSWIDPSQSYRLANTDKGSTAAMASKHHEQSQIPRSGPHTSHLPSTYQCIREDIREGCSWNKAQEPSFCTGSAVSAGSRLPGMGPNLKEPSSDSFPNAFLSSVAGLMDPFSNGFQSSVAAPMLNNLSDSFSLDAGSSKGYCVLPYDKYITQFEPHSTQSPMDPPPPTSGSDNELGVGPIDPLVNCPSGFSSVHFGNPCRISMEYFDYLPEEIKDPVAHSTASRSKVKITAPMVKSPEIEKDTEVVEPRELDVKCKLGNAKSGKPGTGFDLDSSVLEVLDEQSVVLDSPCWKGMPSSSQSIFSKRHTGNSCNFLFEKEIPSGNFVPSETSQDKKLDTVTTGLVNPSEEKAIEEKIDQDFKPENIQVNVFSDNNSKDDKAKGLASAVLPDIAGPQTDVMLLIKSMHGISQALLTSCGGDVFELKEHELELLQMVMDNLKSFTGRINKTDNGGPAISTNIPEEISDGKVNRTTSNEANDNQINVTPQLADTKYKTSILEALGKIPEEDCKVQAELYKNLWIEAEASLCAMKYELQLAHTKLKMKNQKHAQEANSSSKEKPSSSMLEDASDSFSVPKPSSSVQKVGATTMPKQTLWDLNYAMPEEKDIEGPMEDPAVMARFRIIKGRMDNNKSQDQSNAEKNLKENISEQNKDFSDPMSCSADEVQKKDFSSYLTGSVDEVLHDEVDSDVMARLRILQTRGDIGLNAESVLPDYYSLRFATEPRDLYLHAGSSEWEHVLKDELLSSGSSPMNG